VVRPRAVGAQLRRLIRIEFLLALAAALALAVVPAAQATNIITAAHNPGFEDGCGSTPVVPCQWDTTTSAAAVVQDPLHRSGSFSAKVTLTNVSANGILTTCIPGSLAAGYHTASYWYMTPDTDESANVGDLYMNYIGYSSNDCSGIGQGDPNGPITVPSVKDTNWHQVSGVLQNLSGKNSVKVELFFQCTPCSGAQSTTTGTVYYDDVSFEGATAVDLVSLTAARTTTGVRVRWHTGTETDTIGFHVYRERAGKLVRVDRRLIPAKGGVSGARYSVLDRRAPRAQVTYQLQAVGTDGSRTWYGRATVR
jgi:hypothetical protein